MESQDYLKLADACLEAVASWLEDFDPDEVDFATTDGVVTIEFPCGTKYVLNRQAAVHQMWFAARASAWHYDWNAERGLWLDDRKGQALFDTISEVISEKIGRTVHV